jgi:cobyrinic acid a,c-diamide synthase
VDLPASAVEDQPVKTRIAVAHDEAFCFYYEDNLDHLRAAGAQIVTFSPLRDRSLPTGAAGIYLGGGYPELFVDQLADNQELQRAILAAHKAGMPIYAECGGLMYLTERITGLDGQTYPMVGLLPGRASLSKRLTMGYRTITAARDSLLLRRGEQTRGHEFHYSEWLDRPTDAPAAYQVAPRSGQEPRTEGFAHGELLASYVHVHFGAHPQLAPRFVDACCSWAHGECVLPGHTG